MILNQRRSNKPSNKPVSKTAKDRSRQRHIPVAIKKPSAVTARREETKYFFFFIQNVTPLRPLRLRGKLRCP
jgi:hypothetical protein